MTSSEPHLRLHAEGQNYFAPKGSTPIDFAYEIHTDVGNHTEGVRINGEPKPLSMSLRNGDMVQIETNPDAHPNPQ